ncbi:MAG TPA: hypothetical protein VFP69_12705 [Streptomyces sp.]|nr:hypothetical protein [Streptomyces sp.]
MNHGPDEQGPDEQGSAGPDPDEQSPADGGLGDRAPGALDPHDGLDSEELALRSLLRQTVRDVEPRDGTLDHLRRAVPARRARKRQAAVGMAAAALFVCTAVPALVHVSNSSGSDANPSAVGHASQAQGGATQGKDPAGGVGGIGGPAGQSEGKGQDGTGDGGKDNGGPDGGPGVTAGADPAAGDITDGAPLCTAAELAASGGSGAPGSTGAVHGSFRVVSTAAAPCAVGGPGNVGTQVSGAADQAKVGTRRHEAGDAAPGLPDPSTESPALLLEPGAAYEVRFAWVPSETCPAGGGPGGGGPGPSPDPTTTDDPPVSGGDTGTSAQLLTEDGVIDGSVTVTYVSATGASASVTIPNACAGTVYWTGVLAAGQ